MGSRVLTACSFRSKSIPQQVFHRCRSAEALRLFRVPAVYLTSAFLQFFSILLFRRINNLRRINPPKGFDSHPGCLQFLEVRCGGPAWSLDVQHSACWIVAGCRPLGQNHGDEWYSSAYLGRGKNSARCAVPSTRTIDPHVDRTFLIEVFFLSAAQKFHRAVHHEQLPPKIQLEYCFNERSVMPRKIDPLNKKLYGSVT